MHLNHATFEESVFELKSADEGGDEHANEIVTKALADLTASVAERVKAIETKAAERLDKLEAKLNRPNIGGRAEAADADLEVKALQEFYRTGSNVELKALSTTFGTTGVVAPAQLSTTILEKIAEQSPVRSLASSISMTGPMVSIPRLVNEVQVSKVGEMAPDPRPTSEPSFEQIDLKSFEMSVFVPITRIMLEDANLDLNGWIQNHLIRRFAQVESREFVVGNGVSEAEGVLTSLEVGTYNTAGAAITGDDLLEVVYGLKSDYARNGAWLMNRKTMLAVRKLKDAAGGYLWEPSLAAGQPASLFGRPVYEAVDMPDIAPGAVPIIFGDFSTGYLIADRLAFEPGRVDNANSPIIQIGGRRRVGGRVVMGEALKKLKLKA